jgi:hypothetical protein
MTYLLYLSDFLESNLKPSQNPNRKLRPWEKLSHVRPSDSYYTIEAPAPLVLNLFDNDDQRSADIGEGEKQKA